MGKMGLMEPKDTAVVSPAEGDMEQLKLLASIKPPV
jgi:hypothetical protein